LVSYGHCQALKQFREDGAAACNGKRTLLGVCCVLGIR